MLFLAKEYDQEALAKAIWDFSGVIMVLHYRDIEDSKPKEDPKIKKKQVPVKALHIDINWRQKDLSWNSIHQKPLWSH